MEVNQLNTARLTLREFSPKDAPVVTELAGNRSVSKTTRNIPYPYEEGMAELWIESNKINANEGKSLVLAIELSNEMKLIGSVGLIEIRKSDAELGYWVGQEFWGNGYATEAVIAILKHAFSSLNVKSIIAEHLTSNPASGKVMQKSGMKHVKSVQKECRAGVVSNVEIYRAFCT